MSTNDQTWVPAACTLPTVEQPLRVVELDDLFAVGLLEQQRVSPTRLRWRLDPVVEAMARDMSERESSCCSFFTFSFTRTQGAVHVDIEVPAAQVEVLDGLGRRATARMQA